MLHQRRVTVAQRHEDPLAAAEANPDQSMQKCKKSSPVAERQSIQSEAIPPNVIGIARNNTTTQSTSPSIVATGLDPVVHADERRSKHRIVDAARRRGLPGQAKSSQATTRRAWDRVPISYLFAYSPVKRGVAYSATSRIVLRAC
jgi:hypothetical protein